MSNTVKSLVVVCLSLLYFCYLPKTLANERVKPLLEQVRQTLLVDLDKTQGLLTELAAMRATMDKADFAHYAILHASYLGMVGDNRQRITLVRQALHQVDSPDQQVKLLYELSDAHTRLGENEQAMKAMNRGIRLMPKLTDNNAKVSILQGAVTLLMSMDAFDDAMDYADRIYRVGVSTNDSRYICLGLADRANIQFASGQGQSARAGLNRTLQLCNDSEYRFVSNILNASSAINLIDAGEFESGVALAAQVLSHFRQNNPRSAEVNRLIEALSRGYYGLGEYDKAKAYAQQSFLAAEQAQSSKLLKQTSLTLARVNAALNQGAESLKYYEIYVEQAKRFEQDKVAKNLAYQRVKYDNLDKTNQLELLKVKNNSLQLAQKLQARNNDNLILVLSLTAILLLFMTILLVLSFRKKQALMLETSSENPHRRTVNAHEIAQKVWGDARQRQVQFCVILFEIDYLADFDTVVDEDEVAMLTAQVGAICDEQLRHSDHFGRINDHQFVICLLEASAQGAAALAERCRQAISVLDVDGKFKLPLSSSFGVVVVDDQCLEYPEALAGAEKALQEAKDRGGDQVYVHHLVEDGDEL